MRGWRLLIDFLMLVWVIAWVATGIAIAREVRELAQLNETVVSLGRTTEDVGSALGALDDLPLIGSSLRQPAQDIREAGAEAVRSARDSRRSADRLGSLLGISVALIPTASVLALYLPRRLSVLSERRAIARALRRDDPGLDDHLAWRAATRLRADQLGPLPPHPATDVVAKRRRALADAELRRHGLRRTP